MDLQIPRRIVVPKGEGLKIYYFFKSFVTFSLSEIPPTFALVKFNRTVVHNNIKVIYSRIG